MFKNKTIVVTGASSGIGQAQAKLFLQNNANVIGIDRKSSTINAKHYTHYQVDVTNADALRFLQNYQVAVLINSAGVLDNYLPLDQTDEALFDKIMATNIKSMFFTVKMVLPQMLERQQGVIVNMASIAGFLAGGGGIAYTTSKHAVIGFTKQLAYDYAAKGIRVNAIAPGAIKTAMTASDFEGDQAMAKWVAEQTPQKRWGTPEEVAEATLFLAGEQSKFIQGVVLTIDGGWSIQ